MCFFLLKANGNRYEGSWLDGKKNGQGMFLFRERGQIYKGLWVDGVCKCGTLSDCRRDVALMPSKSPIPKVCGKHWLEQVYLTSPHCSDYCCSFLCLGGAVGCTVGFDGSRNNLHENVILIIAHSLEINGTCNKLTGKTSQSKSKKIKTT